MGQGLSALHLVMTSRGGGWTGEKEKETEGGAGSVSQPCATPHPISKNQPMYLKGHYSQNYQVNIYYVRHSNIQLQSKKEYNKTDYHNW